MSQTKPRGILLATLVLFELCVHSRGQFNPRFRPDARFGDESFRSPFAMEYDEEDDVSPMEPPPPFAGPPDIPEEDYEEETDDEYEDNDDPDPAYPGRRCPRWTRERDRYVCDYSSRYGRGRPHYHGDNDYERPRRRGDSGSRYEDRYDFDSPIDPHRRFQGRGMGGYRGRSTYGEDRSPRRGGYGGGPGHYGGRYGGGHGHYGGGSLNSESSGMDDIKVVAERVRKLLGRLRPKNDKKEGSPSEVVNEL